MGVCEVMPELSPTIAERARKNERTILQALAERSQAKAAELMGVHESTVSRFNKAEIAALLAASGLKAVPEGMQCFDPDYVKALKTLAGIGLDSPEPRHLDWST